MEVEKPADNTAMENENEEVELRRGPWTMEEDLILVNYIANHGEGRWNSLARSAGLKRTGKSCRLRWLNYLRPDVRRGNITPEEQLLILELHSRWGNRWSKIAQHLPGRTDNEIKNYWRTRVQKHAKQLKCDVNSKQFRDTMRYLWMPRLTERIRAVSTGGSLISPGYPILPPAQINPTVVDYNLNHNLMPEYSNVAAASSDSILTQVSPVSNEYCFPVGNSNEVDPAHGNDELLMYAGGEMNHGLTFGPYNENPGWFDGGLSETFWNAEDILFLQQQFCGGESVIN